MTISNEKPNTNKLVYQTNGEEVIFYTVSLNEEELRRIITQITNTYGTIKMRPKYDEHYPEGAKIKAAIRKRIIGTPMAAERALIDGVYEIELKELEKISFKIDEDIQAKIMDMLKKSEKLKRKYDKSIETLTRKYIEKEKEVDAEFREFEKAHEGEFVELVVTENMARKETTNPTGSEVLLRDGITCDYVRTEISPMEITANTVDPSSPMKAPMELANVTYRILEYPILAKMLINVLNNPSNIRGLDETINAIPNVFVQGAEYIESILSAINLEPCFTGLKSDLLEIIGELSGGDFTICKELSNREISSNSELYEKYPDPVYYEAYKKYLKGRSKKMN